MKFTFLRVANRLTGISTPVFGASWNPPELEVDVANELITFLEDRRILFVPHSWENRTHVEESVMQTRAELTKILSRVDRESPLGESARAMRTSCLKFLGQLGPDGADGARFSGSAGAANMAAFLGELRGVFGIHIARVAAAYGIDVDENLASILPDEPSPIDDLIDQSRAHE